MHAITSVVNEKGAVVVACSSKVHGDISPHEMSPCCYKVDLFVTVWTKLLCTNKFFDLNACHNICCQ